MAQKMSFLTELKNVPGVDTTKMSFLRNSKAGFGEELPQDIAFRGGNQSALDAPFASRYELPKPIHYDFTA